LIHFYKRVIMSASLGPKLVFSRFKGGDAGVDYEALKKKLSQFQIEKLTFFFKQFFDADGNGVVDINDFYVLNEKLRTVAGWDPNSPEFQRLVDNSGVFLECLLDQVKAEHFHHQEGLEDRTWEEAFAPSKLVMESVTLNQWLNMWAKLCDGAAGINDFPIWVQLLPKILFAVCIGKNKKDVITKDCIRHFYQNFGNVSKAELDKVTEAGYETMTANGDYLLNEDNYNLLFANFLLGRTIYGPGKFLFGCFDNSDLSKKYEIIME